MTRYPLALTASLAALLVASLLPGVQAGAQELLGTPVAIASRSGETPERATPAAAGAFGRSGALRALTAFGLEPLHVPSVAGAPVGNGASLRWISLFSRPFGMLGAPRVGASLQAPADAGIWRLEAESDDHPRSGEVVTVITLVPFSRKHRGALNGYRIGSYPTEGSDRTDRYAPPAGFIEVTPENQDFQISEHFRLRQFLTKNQASVWPKYIALDLRLVDKLELVLQELNAMGVRADRMYVMSGYRTPDYNGPGGDGRAALSRHMYGDAADVWVDSDGNGYMDDLNGDGRADFNDALVMLRAVDRVEARYPELAGGAGAYMANDAHGPFVHIDTRGHRARW